jgi:hypothetical protein
MPEILYLVVGLAVGASLRWWWPRVVERVVEPDTTALVTIANRLLERDKALKGSGHRFRVVAHTDDGASARQLYERASPNIDTTIVFWDGDAVRGMRVAGKVER